MPPITAAQRTVNRNRARSAASEATARAGNIACFGWFFAFTTLQSWTWKRARVIAQLVFAQLAFCTASLLCFLCNGCKRACACEHIQEVHAGFRHPASSSLFQLCIARQDVRWFRLVRVRKVPRRSCDAPEQDQASTIHSTILHGTIA